jgi:peptide/nickel transport system permease protein
MVNAILRTLAAIWLAVTLAFIALRLLPGDAVQAQLTAAGLPAAIAAERRAAAGLDLPVTAQYIRYLSQVARGDLGVSLYSGEAVSTLIRDRAGSTAALAASAVILMAITSVAVASAASREGPLGRVARFTGALAVGLPSYVTGTLAIFVFGLADPDTFAGVLAAALVLGFHAGGPVAMALAESIRHVRGQPHVTAAHARGLRPLAVELHYVVRNAILPVLPLVAAQTGFLFTGTVITETVFARPGLGRLMLDAVLRRDLPVVQGLALLGAVVYGICLVTAELSRRLLDPRAAV